MFFRHEKPQVSSFSELMDGLRKQGFTVQPETGGGMRVSRNGCAAVVTEQEGGAPHVAKAGVLTGAGLALLCDGGYQKFWLTPGESVFRPRRPTCTRCTTSRKICVKGWDW